MFQGRGKKRFRPETAVFHHSSKILPDLLEDVITCFLQGERVCKLCFYRRKLARVVSYKDGFPYCPECKQCEHIWLMPASRFCENFGNFREIPVPQAPHWFMRHRDKPFGVCQKEDHHSCYERSATSDIWFAHTIEELVIWTIEREYGCTFKEYIDRHHSGRTVDSLRVVGGRQPDVFVRGEVGRGRGRPNFTPSHLRERMSLSQPDFDLDDFQESINDIYDPEKEEIMFKSVKEIPPALLEDVARCYVQGMDICKYCFYYRMEEVKKPSDSRGFSPACLRCRSHWDSVKVIPASKFCRNFGNFKKIPIAIPLTRYGEEFHYCPKMNHYQCFQKFPEEGFYYTHSVEELVIWTVERETRVGYGNFGQYIKDNRLVEMSGRSTATPTKSLRKSSLYDPDNCLFLSVEAIPPELHSSIAKCFDKRMNACRTCFFDSLSGTAYNTKPMLSSKEEGTKMCERGHYWRPVRVIPCSNLCKSYGMYIAIPPLPRHMQTSRSPFKVCSMADHQVCFEKTRENNPWFPHTVEEMVIWTVERETGKDYTLIYKKYILKEESEDYTDKMVTMETKEHVKTPNEDVKKVEEVLTSIHDNLVATGNASPQKDITSVVMNLTEGVQDLVSSQVSSETSTGSKVSLPGNPETTPLKFEDLPANDSVTNLLDDNEEYAGDVSLPLGEGGLTIDEASVFFPALINVGNQKSNTINVETTASNRFYTEESPPVTTVPIPIPSLSNDIIQDVNSVDNISIVQPPQTQTMPLQNHVNPEISQGEVSMSLKDDYNIEDNDDDDKSYECYLCYREFDTPREIGHHCNREHHLIIVKKDCQSKRNWKYYPPPPDRSPEEFKLCKKVGKCSGRLRCCKAHSLEELQEWSLRYQHRRQGAKAESPTDLVSMATMGVALSSYNPIKVGVNPSLNEVITIGKSITWTLTIKGQAWQTLLGIQCLVTPTDTPSSLYISAIRGDTIYTIFPKSPQWVAPTYEEGILLGNISVTIKATPTVVGSHDYHVRLFTGSLEYLTIVLKVSCQ